MNLKKKNNNNNIITFTESCFFTLSFAVTIITLCVARCPLNDRNTLICRREHISVTLVCGSG